MILARDDGWKEVMTKVTDAGYASVLSAPYYLNKVNTHYTLYSLYSLYSVLPQQGQLRLELLRELAGDLSRR
jgi:hypothetical protein